MNGATTALPPHPSNGRPGSTGAARPPSSSSPKDGERAYAHLSDLRKQALSGFNPHGNINALLEVADRGLAQAQTLLEFRRPDMSYVEYLRAFQVIAEEMPHHRQWADFQMDRDGAYQRYIVLQKRVNGLADQYANIKDIIIKNNKRSGVQPRAETSGSHLHARRESFSVNGSAVNGNGTSVQKVRPSPSPKPEKLHGRAISISTSSGAGDTLHERFARLRFSQGNADSTRPGSSNSNRSSLQGSPVSMPNPSDFGSRSSIDSMTASQPQQLKPQGPRGMPNGAVGPPIPGKLPLDTNAAVPMPKAPSPTYSPARNMQTTGNIAPPRHSARSLASISTRRSSTMSSSSASYHAPNGQSDAGDYFPTSDTASHATTTAPMPRRKSVHVPKETKISAERLYDYLAYFSILLIDFRPREVFDQGHVYFRNVVCIDPFTIAHGMSASDLAERMVLSPDHEQEMFANRDMYELVVFYDSGTRSEAFRTSPSSNDEMKLKYLHEALYEFNQDKPLQRPPILLTGGIEAWADLVGNQALATSSTSARGKQSGLQRRPVATPAGSTQLRLPKRRLRDYNPLDADEERNWRERARAESVVLPPTPVTRNGEDNASDGLEDDESKSAIQEFLERFPEAASIDHQPFIKQPHAPIKSPPEIPAKLPSYPAAPPASQFPSVPTRPKPAAPRPSYTGVSERSGSQNVPAPRSKQLAPYVPAKYLATNLRLPKTGLQNFGQTCYMNATLQALSATTPLSIFFLDDNFKHMVQPKNWKGTKGVMPELYSNLVRSLWKGDVNFIRPSTFRTFCGRLKSEWGTNEQQDAKEFFDFVVDCLHEDFNGMWSRTPLRALTPQEEANRERTPKSIVAKVEWDRYLHREQSFLTELFAGQHFSRLRCSYCGWTSTTYEAFYSISVEIPKPRASGHIPSLDDCLRSYCQEERLTGDDRFKCEGKCNAMRDGTKQLIITRVPQFLVVHFKRFTTNNFGRMASKIRTPINFPLTDFNLEPYVLPVPSGAEAQHIADNYGPEHLENTPPSMTPPYSYDAYAVVRHIGATLQSGHYTAAVKDRARGVWRYFNDERNEDFQPDRRGGAGDLRNEQAYIVFYQRSVADRGGRM